MKELKAWSAVRKMATFYQCIRADSREVDMSSTRIMDIKMREAAEGLGEDSSGKKKSKFKTFKKLFGKKKRKETSTSASSSSWKPTQSESDVIAPVSLPIGYDSEDELEDHKGTLGNRALSHDSIFIPETGQDPPRPARVFSQENVSERIRALQMKIQYNMKLGPPPPCGIPNKRGDDAGMSSEDDGLPRSPPEISLLHDINASTTTKFSDPHKHLSSLSLAGTGSEEEEQVSIVSSRPLSPDHIFSRHASETMTSPRTSDSSLSPLADFDYPPEFSSCLDNSAAKHKLLVKPRNQRSSKMRRLCSRAQSESLSDLTCTPEEEEEDGKQMLKDHKDENSSYVQEEMMDKETIANSPEILKSEISEEPSQSQEDQDEKPGVSQLSDIIASTGELSSVVNNLETTVEVSCAESDHLLSLDPSSLLENSSSTLDEEQSKETSLSAVSPPTESTCEELVCTLNEVQNQSADSPLDIPSPKAISNTTALSSSLDCSEKNIQESKDSLEMSDAGESMKESTVIPDLGTQLPKSCLKNKSSSVTSSPSVSPIPLGLVSPQLGPTPWHLEKNTTPEEVPKSEQQSSPPTVTGGGVSEGKLERGTSEVRSSRKFSVSSSWERPKASSLYPKEHLGSETPSSTKLSLLKTNLAPKNEVTKDNLQMNTEHQEGKLGIIKQAVSVKSDSQNSVDKEGDHTELSCTSPASSVLPPKADPCPQLPSQPVIEDKNPFQVKLRSTSLSFKYRDGSFPESKGMKRYSAEIRVEKGGLTLLSKDEKTRIKRLSDISAASPLNDKVKGKAKSSEQLSHKPPLPKKPVLQTVTTPHSHTLPPGNLEKLDKLIKSPESRNETKTLEKKLPLHKVAEKNMPSPASAPGASDGHSLPPWITLARQKRRGSREQQQPSKEEKLVTPARKADTEKPRDDLDRKEERIKQQADFVRSKSFLVQPAKTAEEQKPRAKLTLKEGLHRGISLSHQNLAQAPVMTEKELNQLKRASYSSADQPSWMELAKKKSQAWSDMPQIIK
ncbi:CRACD-like protein isoform X2 [Antechinus flavipes]|uniref:CRACD-like protein isoform X2 n=1 Tax=Antechinus flavipes TaxID=38775 RepID=UPI0022368579|nr:CRACD-like protein isoform X2 [Antechinus flavipes]